MKQKLSTFIIVLAICMGVMNAVGEFENLKAEANDIFARGSIYLLSFKSDGSTLEDSNNALIAKADEEEVEPENETLASLDTKKCTNTKTKTLSLKHASQSIIDREEIEQADFSSAQEIGEFDNTTADNLHAEYETEKAKAAFVYSFNEKSVTEDTRKLAEMRKVMTLRRVTTELNKIGVPIPQISIDEANLPKTMPCPSPAVEKRGERSVTFAPESLR